MLSCISCWYLRSYIGYRGAVFAARFFSERLALVYVGPQAPTILTFTIGGRSDMEVSVRKVAKLLRALSICIEYLKAHYSAQSNHSSFKPFTYVKPLDTRYWVAPPPAATLPYDSFDPSRFICWKSFTVDGQKYNLNYTQRLTPWMENTVC